VLGQNQQATGQTDNPLVLNVSTVRLATGSSGGTVDILLTDTDLNVGPSTATAAFNGSTGRFFSFDFFGDSSNQEFERGFEIASSGVAGLTGPFDERISESIPSVGSLTIGFRAGLTAITETGGATAELTLDPAQTPVALRAGDANQDLKFDQLDLIQVLRAQKYNTGVAATWGEGDWNGAPGGSQGDPPAGNGFFDQFDVVAAQQADIYLQGPYGAIQSGGITGDSQTSIGYNAQTGEVWVDAPAAVELTSINIDSALGIFTGDPAQNLGGSFDNDADSNIFKATFGSSFGSLSFGRVAAPGLSEQLVSNDLTVVGSLAGGGDLGEVDLVYVPEPTSVLLLAHGLVIGLIRSRRTNC
jgi:hypothetical protein